MAVTQDQLREISQAYEKQIAQSFPGLLDHLPVASYVSQLEQRNPLLQYEQFPPSLLGNLLQMRARHGQNAVALFHKLGLCRLMANALESLEGDTLPETIRQHYRSWFERIVEDFDAQPETYYDLDRPLWPLRKDLGVSSRRSIPIGGAWVIETRSLAKGAMIRQAQAKSTTRFRSTFLRRFSRKDTCYVIHTVERNIREFNAEQMDLAYCNIARLLQRNDSVWGVFRSSWFLDPTLGEISPKMAFLSETPANHGAELYDGGPCSEDDIRKATSMSPERSHLYETGAYVPRNYFYFWPREAVIRAFGANQPALQAQNDISDSG